MAGYCLVLIQLGYLTVRHKVEPQLLLLPFNDLGRMLCVDVVLKTVQFSLFTACHWTPKRGPHVHAISTK